MAAQNIFIRPPLDNRNSAISFLPIWPAASRPVSKSQPPQSHEQFYKPGSCFNSSFTFSRSLCDLPTNSLTNSAGNAGSFGLVVCCWVYANLPVSNEAELSKERLKNFFRGILIVINWIYSRRSYELRGFNKKEKG